MLWPVTEAVARLALAANAHEDGLLLLSELTPRFTRLAIDFVIHYVKSNGRHAEKVFKLATKELAVGETIQLRKKHRFQQRTTRVHHRGTHLLELQINGQRHGRSEFHVET